MPGLIDSDRLGKLTGCIWPSIRRDNIRFRCGHAPGADIPDLHIIGCCVGEILRLDTVRLASYPADTRRIYSLYPVEGRGFKRPLRICPGQPGSAGIGLAGLAAEVIIIE